jgi:endonuclease YncB( thermonuclease family)
MKLVELSRQAQRSHVVVLRVPVAGLARDFRRYLGRREVACEPAGTGYEYRCRVDDQDLSRVVLFNGGGRATANATPELRALDQQARSTRVGIWSGGGDEDD